MLCRTAPCRTTRSFLAAILILPLCLGTAIGQMTPEQQADLLLNGARRAYNEASYPFAIQKFREFLQRFGSHAEVPAARYGLALALLGGAEKDYQGAFEQLQPLLARKDSPDFPFVLYYTGYAQRGLGIRELSQALAKPQEANQRRQAANGRFEEAVKNFGLAADSFSQRKKSPEDLEWMSRARCDQAEMLIRIRKPKEALAAVTPWIQDAAFAKNGSRRLGLYYHGFAQFLLGDYLQAGRSLNQLVPFQDPEFGTHSRYLLARVHQLSGERAEAALHFEGILADYAKVKQLAVEALKKPENFKSNPEEKARLEAVVRGPAPDHVAGAMLASGTMLYEAGKFGDAFARFQEFDKQFPNSPLAVEARLRRGFCQVQLRLYGEAVQTLQPIAEKEPTLADQALFWIAKAQAGLGDPNNPQAIEQAIRGSLDTLRRAAERAGQLAAQDPDAKTRRGEILLELADNQQAVKQFKEAAATYGQILAEKSLEKRLEEVQQRRIAAVQLAGDYLEVDKLCGQFLQQFPKSTLLPAVLFRFAENSYFQAMAVEKNPAAPNRAQELTRLHDEAAKRYQVVADRYPEFAHAAMARYGVAMAFYRKGDWEKAKVALEAIPAPERNGELGIVPYLLADCLMRLAPVQADDALAAGKLQEQLQGASELLSGYVAVQPPNGPRTADALLKLGLCQQRLASLMAQPPEKARILGEARATYDKMLQQFAKDPLFPQAVYERAKCLALAGDKNGAMNEFRRFTADPLRSAAVAPLGCIQLSLLLREQKKPADVVPLVQQCRQVHEAAMVKDVERLPWLLLLMNQQGLALKESGKIKEAREQFEQMVKLFPDRPESAEAVLRWGQCQKEEGLAKIDLAKKQRAAVKKPEEMAAADKSMEEALNVIREAGKFLEDQAGKLQQKQPQNEMRARLLYEAAWAHRLVGDVELAVAKERSKTNAAPVQPGEQKARALYQGMLSAFPDLALGLEARFELAEMLGNRAEFDAAVRLLQDALDKEPNGELTDKVRVRLGACLFAKGDRQGALGQFQAVTQNPKSAQIGQAQYRLGECLIEMGQHAEAVKILQAFRDRDPFRNMPGLTDRALLRLGHAFAHLKQWDQSRQAHEQVIGRFGNGPWALEARYGIGWAWQSQSQWDNAVNNYIQVANATISDLGAKSQLQIGLCRLEQKRHAEAASALLAVPFSYDYPELSAVALCEAARSFTELKQKEQAQKLLQRVLRDHPESQWAQVAKDRLEALKKLDTQAR